MIKRKSSRPMTITNVTLITYPTVCQLTRTVGNWDDPQRWSLGRIPNATDHVLIPLHTGVIVMQKNIQLSSLMIEDGTLQGYQTECPESWTASYYGNKCWKMISQPLPFDTAEKYCHQILGDNVPSSSSSVGGSIDRHLAHVRDRNEGDEILGLCRGASLAIERGCWIGMKDTSGTGMFDWLVPTAVGGGSNVTLYLDWRRYEPNNHTVSHDIATMGGERCVATYPGLEDPLRLEQGGWEDDACSYARPFICQAFKETNRYQITISGAFQASGGVFLGGNIVLTSSVKSVIINQLTLDKGAYLISYPSMTIGGELFLEDGSTLEVRNQLHLSSGSFIGEKELTNSSVSLQGNTTSSLNGTTVGNQPRVIAATLMLLQGGELSLSQVRLPARSSQLVLHGYAGRLSTYDAFELKLMNRGPFLGEYRGQNSTLELSTHAIGVYRLLVNSSRWSSRTECIPYNATATELASFLNALPIASAYGGIVIRRYGSQWEQQYGYGFTYRIELPQVTTSMMASGPVSMAIACYGMPACPVGLNYSVANSEVCNVSPKIHVSRMSTLAYTNTTGSGDIVLSSGSHRLPAISYLPLVVNGVATGIVAADVIRWLSFQTSQYGQLIITSLGWPGWDSATLLYAPFWTDQRGLVSYLKYNVSACYFYAHSFIIDDLSAVLVAAPSSSLVWYGGNWNGGIIGGLANLTIQHSLVLDGTGKSIQHGLYVVLASTAIAYWYEGNISLANGARMIIEGNFTIDNRYIVNSLSYPMAIGEAEYLNSSSSSASILLKVDDDFNWQSYFDSSLVSALRPGWYTNPLCEDECNRTNLIYFTQSSILTATSYSSVLFLLPIDLLGSSKMNVGVNANITLASGGTCGNDVIVNLSEGTTLTLNGGNMEMQATCTIQGAGELVVASGYHFLAFSIDAHITISGGGLIWPESRGTQKTITLNGGMLIEGEGRLEVQPFSTTVVVHQTVELTGNSSIQFPLIGIAAQASPFDSSDAPDSSPRGNFTATGTMLFYGGTLTGKADFNIMTELFLDGSTKYIQSLAKLVNKGHCEWGAGDLIASNNGDFQNFGTVQMRYGSTDFSSNAYYIGSAVPIENGGDVFAKDFHSWDTDLGALSTSEYTRLTSELVSRVPNGWTAADQGDDDS
eukprot:scaffold2421_cov171-Ochromonas_danica.AAC.11